MLSQKPAHVQASWSRAMTSIEIGLEPEGEEGGYDDESSVANESLSGALQDLADPNKNDNLLNLNED